MRDLYQRKQRLQSWIERINTELDESDKNDVLRLVEHMQDRERSVLWIIRCITALFTIRKKIGKQFKDVTKEDIRSFLKWMEQRGYKPSTNEKFRQILKLFFKIVYGNEGEYYPDQVKWFSVKLGKEKVGKDTSMDMSEYLEEEEVQKLIEFATTLQKKAFLACMYESGARPEEFLRITNRDMRIDKDGVVLMLRGKTGERRVRIVAFSKMLQQWMDVHPLRNEQYFPLWISESTNFKNQPMGIRGAERIIEEILPKTGIPNKHARLYILRHSRATHSAKHFTEAEMCTFFGWVQGTQVVKRYIHLSGRDLDKKLIAITNGTENVKMDNYKLKPFKCQRCSENVSPGTSFCGKCGLSVKISEQYMNETDIERESKELKVQLRSVLSQVSLMKEQLRNLIFTISNMDQNTKNIFARQMIKNGVLK